MTAKVKTYIIHMGKTNKKVRGHLVESFNSQTGQRFLTGTEIIRTLHWTDRQGKRHVDEVEVLFRMEITKLKYTVRG